MNRQRRSADLLSQLIGLNILKYVKDSCKFQTSIWNKILDLLRVTVGLPEEAASFAQQQAECQHRCRRARGRCSAAFSILDQSRFFHGF